MSFLRFFVVYLSAVLILPFLPVVHKAYAMPVINEVMWAGSDISSSDEWVELTSDIDIDLSGWKFSYITGKGEEKSVVTFATGTVIPAGGFLVIARQHADSSRLSSEPQVVTSSLSLLNEGLVLRLRRSSGEAIDEVNAGTSVPFAGANPTGGAGRASMERIDALGSGSDKANWHTATAKLGFDGDANVFGTPGFANGPFSSSSSSSFSSSSSGSSASACFDPLVPSLVIQSGSPTGIGKVTINFQVIAQAGSLTDAACHFDFGDGTTSDSCNPPVRTFDQPGVYLVQAEVKNQCDNTLILEQTVEVYPDSEETVIAMSGSFDGSRVVLTGAMPNPPATDKDKEWLELKNLEDRTVDLTGWKVALGKANPRHYSIKGITFLGPGQVIRLYQSESKLTLSNNEEKVGLINPDGTEVSSISWTDAEEGRVYKPDDFRHEELRGTVAGIVDGDTFRLLPDAATLRLIHEENITVRLLGIDAPETVDPDKPVQPYGPEAAESLRNMIEGQSVILLLDKEVWDSYGRLLAYVYIDDGRRLVQHEMLLAGMAEVFRKYDFSKKEEFLSDEAMAKQHKAGRWVNGSADSRSATGTALLEKAKVSNVEAAAVQIFPGQSFSKVSISEVFPSPQPSPAGSGNTGSILSQEWIELHNPEDSTASLYRWSITVGKKMAVIGRGWEIPPKGYIVLPAHPLGLKLPNAGSKITLRSPDGSYSQTLSYPKVSNGSSFIIEADSLKSCITKTPSPGEGGKCPVVSSTLTAGQKRKIATTLKYADSYIKDVKGEAGTADNIVWDNRPAGGQLLSAIILSFLAGLGSFAAAQGLIIFRRRSKGQ